MDLGTKKNFKGPSKLVRQPLYFSLSLILNTGATFLLLTEKGFYIISTTGCIYSRCDPSCDPSCASSRF